MTSVWPSATRTLKRWQFVRGAVGARCCYQFSGLSSAQAEVDPPAEHHAGGDAMAATNLRYAGTRLLRLLHDRSLLLVAEATPI